MKHEIKTDQPIKIEIEIKSDFAEITLDGIPYFYIDGVGSLGELKFESIEYYIKETYHDEDYKNEQYYAPTLTKYLFAEKGK